MYRYLSGLALQDADLAGVVRLISDRTSATVAVLTQLMDVLTAAAPGVSAEKAAAEEIARDNGWAVEARDERLADAPGGVVVVTAVDARR